LRLHIVEVVSDQWNHGKIGVGQYDEVEWRKTSVVDTSTRRPLLMQLGWAQGEGVWVLDLQTGEGAYFNPRPLGVASSDLRKSRIYVCPLFEPFLQWLYVEFENLGRDVDRLPPLVELTGIPQQLYGYRRPGRCEETTEE
jgi:hypothetical protein